MHLQGGRGGLFSASGRDRLPARGKSAGERQPHWKGPFGLQIPTLNMRLRAGRRAPAYTPKAGRGLDFGGGGDGGMAYLRGGGGVC